MFRLKTKYLSTNNTKTYLDLRARAVVTKKLYYIKRIQYQGPINNINTTINQSLKCYFILIILFYHLKKYILIYLLLGIIFSLNMIKINVNMV